MKSIAWIEHIICIKCDCGHVEFNYGNNVPARYTCPKCNTDTQVHDKTKGRTNDPETRRL